MSNPTAAQASGVSPVISQLIEISKFDTLFRDLYFQRARDLLGTLLPYSSYINLKESIASVPWLEQQLRAAVERSEWERSCQLTERIRTSKEAIATESESIRQAGIIYEGLADIPIDPFSSGFHVFVGGSAETLRDWKRQASEILSTLQRVDPSKGDFYARRAADFKALSIAAPSEYKDEKKTSEDDPAQLQQQALSALESGDLSLLDRMVQQLRQKSKPKEQKDESADIKLAEAPELKDDFLYSFSEATLEGARSLGLAPVRTQSRRQFASLMPHGWQPGFMKDETRQRSKEQVQRLTYLVDAGDKVKAAIEFFLLNPFINSGGTRYQVCLVVEDLLIEDFAEPESKEGDDSELSLALELESRWGLSRIDIENALLQHGPRIVEQKLKLDPEAFRLVAIPPDIYTHLGPERGWGQKERWTHFDGYRVLAGGKLQALAGGDKRFGGTHDVVSFSPAYANDKILARFAVVQRKRMMSWHKR